MQQQLLRQESEPKNKLNVRLWATLSSQWKLSKVVFLYENPAKVSFTER